jgi:O-antigen/teichoic acid export membrane protein
MAEVNSNTMMLANGPVFSSLAESPVHRTVGAGILSGVSLVLKICGNIITIPLAIRFLGKQEYGLFVVLQSLSTYFALCELGIGQSVLNFQNVAYAQGEHGQVNRILTTTFGLYCLIATPIWLLSTLVIATQPVGAWFLKDAPPLLGGYFKPYLFVVATLALLRVPLVVFPVTLLGVRESALRQWVEFANAVFLLVGTVTVLFLGGRLLALIVVTNLGLIALALSAYPLVRVRHPEIGIGWKYWTPALLAPIFGNSIFFFLYNVGLLFQRLVANLLAARFGSLNDVTELFVLLTIFRVVGWSVADVFSYTLQPYIILLSVSERHDRLIFFTRMCTKVTVSFALTFSGLIWLLSDAVIRLWLGPGMFVGYGPLLCLALSFLIDVTFLPTSNFMRSVNCHRQLSLCMVSYALATLAFGIVGAKFMTADPVFGICAGMLAASVVTQAIAMPMLAREWLQLSWSEYLGQLIVRPAWALLPLVVVMFLIGRPADIVLWQRVAGSALLLAGMSAIMWWSTFTIEEQDWTRHAVRRLSGISLEAAN